MNETLTLLKRQAEFETAMKRPGDIRIVQEQELHTIRRRVGEVPEAAKAILQAAHGLRRAVTEVSVTEVEVWVSDSKVA